jgi:hypothetical protein
MPLSPRFVVTSRWKRVGYLCLSLCTLSRQKSGSADGRRVLRGAVEKSLP